MEPTPDFSGIAKAAACHKAWAGKAVTVEQLNRLLPAAIEAVLKDRIPAVLDARVGVPAVF